MYTYYYPATYSQSLTPQLTETKLNIPDSLLSMLLTSFIFVVNYNRHQEDHRFLLDIVTLSSGAPEESTASSTSLAEKVAQARQLKNFIESYILITTLLGITHTTKPTTNHVIC